MLNYELTKEEQVRRSTLANNARDMIRANMTVEAEDETSMTLDYRGYYMQISFSPLHPLLVMCLAKAIRNPGGTRTQQRINELNLHSVLGSHAINNDAAIPIAQRIGWIQNSRHRGFSRYSTAASTRRIVATAASPGKKPMNKETPSYSMFVVSNDKRHGIVRITGHDPGVQARGPPARVPFHCIP